MKSTLLSMILICLIFTSCKNDSTKEQPNKQEVTETTYKYKVTPFKPSQSYPDAKINGYTYNQGKFSFDVSGTKYELGQQTPDADSKMCANSKKGQHIHLIVDNAPYAAKYTADFDYQMPKGEHHVLAFLSRSYHESIKTTDAFTAQKVNISDDGQITSAEDIKHPALFYSRPKGTYIGDDTKKVMLDFYLANATLGKDFKVKADINGEVQILDKWQPYYIEGLPIGENTITLTLLDSQGQMANVPLNPVTRKFTLKENLDSITN